MYRLLNNKFKKAIPKVQNYAQQADSPDRISPVIIATTPARKIPVDTRPVILVVRLIRIP